MLLYVHLGSFLFCSYEQKFSFRALYRAKAEGRNRYVIVRFMGPTVVYLQGFAVFVWPRDRQFGGSLC